MEDDRKVIAPSSSLNTCIVFPKLSQKAVVDLQKKADN